MLGPLRVWFPLISNLDTCRGHVCEEDWASEQALEPEGVGPRERWPAWGGVAAIARSRAAIGGLRKAEVVVNLIINLGSPLRESQCGDI